MDRPLISIITPSYNQAQFLGATLRSVAAQDYESIQHIVMDGGSSDGSVEVIRKFADDHPLVWSSEPDQGQADAIQRGFQSADGEVLGWLNSDDIYLDDRVISDVMREFDRGADVVTGSGWHLTRLGIPFHHIGVQPERLSFKTLRCAAWILQPATFFRRSLFLEHGLDTSLHYGFDWDLFIRFARQVRITPIERDIAGYRIHQTGKSVSGGSRRRQELAEVTGRYSGTESPRYRLITAVNAFHRAAEILPGPLSTVGFLALYCFSRFTNMATGGRGIAY